MQNIKRRLCEQLKQILKYEPTIKTVILFGSYAKGIQDKRSDLDLLVIQDTKERFFDRLKDIEMKIMNRLNIYPEIISYTPKEFEQIKERAFIQTILKEGITIYEYRKK